MEFVFSWVAANWFQALQAIAISSGLIFTGVSFRQTARIQKGQTLINLTQQHRAIWFKLLDSPKLKRVLDASLPKRAKPTDDEALFVNLIILHTASTLNAVRKGILDKPTGADADLKELFSLPIPREVWRRNKKFHDARTVRYMDDLLK